MPDKKGKGHSSGKSRSSERKSSPGEMTTEEAGRRGGQKVKELIEEGKQATAKKGKG